MALTIEINHARTRAKAAAAGQPVVPQAVKGRIRRIKWLVLLLTLSIYYATPFLRWDRGRNAPDQALLLDFVHGRLYFFFAEIWPQDLYLVTGLLVLASTILILTNALAGRLWCGFACPQTVWTDLFLLVERVIEGDRRQRLKNLGARLDPKRVMQIAAKHSAWLLISLATGGTLIFYFTDAPELLRSFARGDVSANTLCWIVAFAGTTYGLAGFAREQVCTFMCPWPRLQGAIWDPEAFTVNYRDYRGEQRTSAKKAAELRLQGKPAGDCVDCNRCVTVCPIGIGRGAEPPISRLVRPKTVGLTAACLVLTAAIVFSFMTKTSASLSVQHDRDPLAVRLSDGSVRNAYTVKLLNKSSATQAYTLSVSGMEAKMAIIGNERLAPIEVPADGSEAVRVTLTAMSPREAELVFTARDESGTAILSVKDRFVER